MTVLFNNTNGIQVNDAVEVKLPERDDVFAGTILEVRSEWTLLVEETKTGASHHCGVSTIVERKKRG
jgi:hypothetical protein